MAEIAARARPLTWQGRLAAARLTDRGAAFGLLVLAVALRLAHLSRPAVSLDGDEADWVYTGVTLLRNGRPTGWTLFASAYGVPEHWDWDGHGNWIGTMVQPYVDHPPAFSILMGTFGVLRGDSSWLAAASDGSLRVVAVALSALSLWLAFELGRRLVGGRAALVGLALLAVSPGALILGRLVAAEQLLAVMLLGALLAIESAGRWRLPLLAIACALAPLTKASGMVVAGTAIVLLIHRRELWGAAAMAGAGVMGALGAILYAVDLNGHAYFAEAGLRMHAMAPATVAYQFIAAPMATGDFRLLDGVWLLGWAGLIGLGLGPRGRPIVWPAAIYLALMVVMAAGYAGDFAWYRITILPLVYLGAASLLEGVWRSLPRLAIRSLPLLRQ